MGMSISEKQIPVALFLGLVHWALSVVVAGYDSSGDCKYDKSKNFISADICYFNVKHSV